MARLRAVSAPDPRGADLPALLGRMLGHVNRRSAGQTVAIMHGAGLTMSQLVALHVLAFRGPHTVGALARCLRLSLAATSHLVHRLVQARLVGRTEDARDRRRRHVAITEAGRRLIDRLEQERTREFSDVLARLSAATRRQFAAALVRVIDELAETPPPPSATPEEPS